MCRGRRRISRATAAPEVESLDATAAPAAVTVTFSRYMQLDAADRIAVTDSSGHPLEGSVQPVDAEDVPDGRFARTLRFVPAAPIATGDEFTLSVRDMASSTRPPTAPAMSAPRRP